MKKKLLFVVTYFDTGGISRSLQTLLKFMDTSKYDVDVFGMVHQGAFTGQFQNCRILSEDKLLSALMCRLDLQRGWKKWICAGIKIMRRAFPKTVERCIFKRAAKRLAKRRMYDATIAFSEGAPTQFVSLMECPKKIAWIHCNYASYRTFNPADESAIYDEFDYIVNVSEATAKSFVGIYPQLKEKVRAIHNVMDVEGIRAQARHGKSVAKGHDDPFRLVSVGRIDPVKRLSIIPEIARQLKKIGLDFVWRIIGPLGGVPEENQKFLQGIGSEDIHDCVKYLGEQKNPYPEIAAADVLVNTSKSEACPYVVNEALILGTPVLCTDFPSAKEFVTDGVNGRVAPIDEFPKLLAEWINKPSLLDGMRNNLAEFRFDNASILQETDELLK